MSEPKPFASLSPTLLARKGSARPAMRPQIQPLHQFHEATARQLDEDLGWNDMGEDQPVETPKPAEVVRLNGAVVPEPKVPEVVRQQERVARSVAARQPARAPGKRAAFTLRLDVERHLKLRLACTIANRSAQHLVTEALDRYLDAMPEVGTLAAQVSKRG